MNKILDFGRKALFYARVLSGYEERRIRSYRLQVEKRIKQVLFSMTDQPQNPKPRKVQKKVNSYFLKNDVVMGDIPSSVVEEPSCSVRVESHEIDVNHIERDPGKRPAISSYPINERDEVRRKYMSFMLQAEERKLAIRKLPEQTILSEVRRMVEEMQNLNKKLEETEAAIEDYFKPLDQEAQRIMKTQLEGEERTMKQMMKTMHDQAMLDIAEEERKIKAQIVDTNQKNQDPRPNTQHLPPPP